MELVYMWVKDYGHLKNIGLNFGGKHLFQVEYLQHKEMVEREDEIKIKKENNSFHIENFFNTNNKKANIINVTAIIGGNGAGKSAILEIIQKIGPKVKDAFFILKDGDEYIRTELLNTGKAKYKFTGLYPKHSVEKLPNVIFYSNMFQTSTFNRHRIYAPFDLSTMRYLSEGIMQNKKFGTVLTEYNLAELNRQMDFVSNFYEIITDDFEFKIPTQITISESHIFINNNKEIDEKEITTLLNTDEDIQTKLMNFIPKIDFSNLIRVREYFTDNLQRIMKNMFLQWFITILNSEGYEFRNLENSILGYSGNHDFYSFLESLDNNQLKSLLGIFDILVKIAYNYPKHSKALSYTITDNIMGNFKEDNDNITKLVRLLKKTDYTSNLLQFKWRDMSSGELAILTLFSRFHSIKNKIKSDNIIILLDEPDMYLNPSWVQKFIKAFIEYLNKDFSGKTIQIILTSNKPICTSDLPANNVIRLEKKGYDRDNWPIVKVKKDDGYQSFGANIYSLYKDGFFLNEGFMGIFAKRKIQDVIEWLNDENNYEDEENIKKVIEIIGEPVLKSKLQMMYNFKMEKSNDKNSSGK